MSCSKGNINRTRPQKYQNRTAYKNTLHDTSKETKRLNNFEVKGVCKRCKEIIEWKIKYNKYKALTAPTKCVCCNTKCVRYAYHALCTDCANLKNVCSKCRKPKEETENEVVIAANTENNYQSILKDLPERRKRTILRGIRKHEEEGTEVTKEIVENLISEIYKDDLEDSGSEHSNEDFLKSKTSITSKNLAFKYP